MKPSLSAGITSVERVEIDRDRTISFLGDEGRVYATPSMVRDVEMAALRLIALHLDDGESSVGVHIALDHLGATPQGAWVEVTVRVTGLEKRRVSLEAEVRDAVEVVGRGEHVRFVIDTARHRERLAEKIGKLESAG